MSSPGRSDGDEVKRTKGRSEEGLTDSEPNKTEAKCQDLGSLDITRL
jgi:hypothetical protein